jgi:mono/diheme cytochrome c family protein
MRRLIFPCATALVLAAAPIRAATPAPAKLSFNNHVQPILAENCYACHGIDPGSRKAELRLDRFEFAIAKRKDGPPAIVPGKPDESPLIERLETRDEKKIMPPPESHKTLKPEQIATLRRWIAEGAEYEAHWSFIAPQRPAVPAASAAKSPWKANPVDRFIFARMERDGLTPSAEADRRSLIRRVTLDLTGIIPTAAEVDAFVADKSRDAYEKVVDRLLASPRYGEHRARYWLDYVRYADTHGIHFDNYRAIWPYRDYVIRAFNQNKRFDTFVREQLAGDLLPARTLDELAATGFVRCNPPPTRAARFPKRPT